MLDLLAVVERNPELAATAGLLLFAAGCLFAGYLLQRKAGSIAALRTSD